LTDNLYLAASVCKAPAGCATARVSVSMGGFAFPLPANLQVTSSVQTGVADRVEHASACLVLLRVCSERRAERSERAVIYV
jgi:hypothetical protein